jgi:hypothetical protein
VFIQIRFGTIVAIDERKQPTSSATVQRCLPPLAQDRLVGCLRANFNRRVCNRALPQRGGVDCHEGGAGGDPGDVFVPAPGYRSEKCALQLSSAGLKNCTMEWILPNRAKIPCIAKLITWYSHRAPVATEIEFEVCL